MWAIGSRPVRTPGRDGGGRMLSTDRAAHTGPRSDRSTQRQINKAIDQHGNRRIQWHSNTTTDKQDDRSTQRHINTAAYQRSDGAIYQQNRSTDMYQDPRHLFSLIPDPDQNKKDTYFISVVAYGYYVTLSCPIQFCLLSNQNFEMPKILQILRNPGSKIPWVLPIFMVFKSFHQINPLPYNAL